MNNTDVSMQIIDMLKSSTHVNEKFQTDREPYQSEYINIKGKPGKVKC
jgi:hypothetical protein